MSLVSNHMDELERILIINFGGQYSHLISKRIREAGVYTELRNYDAPDLEEMIDGPTRGIILSGGPRSVNEPGAPTIDPGLLTQVPVLGICYGMQLMTKLFGGEVESVEGKKEYGSTLVNLTDSPLFTGIPPGNIETWMSHGDSVIAPPRGFRVVGQSADHIAAIANPEEGLYAVQFHPEVTHTTHGNEILRNFARVICGCEKEWSMEDYVAVAVRKVQEQVGDKQAICLLSGGVDSSVVAAIMARALPSEQLHFIHLSGMMRKNETPEIIAALAKAGITGVKVIDLDERYLNSLRGLRNSEEKRKRGFIPVYSAAPEEAIAELNLPAGAAVLGQGTLYTDKVESGQGVGKQAVIKTHHNVGGGVIAEMRARGDVVEPLDMLYKNEVRTLARQLGLPEKIASRQPFPGPGMSIRIVDAWPELINEAYHEAEAAIAKIADQYSLRGHLLPVKTVGVQGDERTYQFLTLLQGARQWEQIRAAASAITNRVPFTNRVVYEIGDSPVTPETISTTVTPETLAEAREADCVGREVLASYGLDRNISQTIFTLFGADIHGRGQRSVALRAVTTNDFMTVQPVVPWPVQREQIATHDEPIGLTWECLDEIAERLKRQGIGAFVYDVTNKPPATTEWE